MGDRGPLALVGPPAFAPDPGLAGLGPELRRHGLARPQASARLVCGVCPVSPSSMHMPPGHPVTPAKIFGGCHHCVIAISLTVSDAADLCKRYDPESRPTWPRSIRFAGSWCLPICWGGPDGGLMPSTAAKPTAPPSSSGLGHRPFKAAARVRIPLGARPDQEAARALAAMRWRVSRARRPGRAAGAPGRGPPGSAAPWTSSSGRRRRDRPRPARSAGWAAVAASQRRMMQPESRAHQRSARFGMGGQFISAERAGRLVLPNGLRARLRYRAQPRRPALASRAAKLLVHVGAPPGFPDQVEQRAERPVQVDSRTGPESPIGERFVAVLAAQPAERDRGHARPQAC